MTERYLESRRESGFTGNFIPCGRQLQRTPPPPGTDVKRHLDFSDEHDSEDFEEQQRVQAGSRNEDESEQSLTSELNTFVTKSEQDDPDSMLKGMKDYQLTQSDLDFIRKMKEEKLIKKLQGDLEETQKSLKMEMMEFELACATREKARAELKKFPSCEDLTEWMKAVLSTTSPLSDLTDVDAKSLLGMLTGGDVHRAVDEKRSELARMEKTVAKKKKREAMERGQLEEQMASEQLKIRSQMSQLFSLKSELAQQEEACKALQMQISTQDTKVEAEEVKTSEEPQATKARSRGKEKKKAGRSVETLQHATNQRKASRSKEAESQSEEKRSTRPAAAEEEEEEELNTGPRRSKRIASRS